MLGVPIKGDSQFTRTKYLELLDVSIAAVITCPAGPYHLLLDLLNSRLDCALGAREGWR